MSVKQTELQNELAKAGLLDKIKSIFLKLSEVPAAPAPVIPAAPVTPVALATNEIKLADGSSIVVEGETIVEGAKVQKVTPEGMVEIVDGDYPATDGTIYTVAGGLITKIVPVAAPAAPDMPAMMKAVTDRLTALEAKFTATDAENKVLKTKLSEQDVTIAVAFKALNTIVSMPASAPIEPGSGGQSKRDLSKIPYEQMTNFEKLKFNRGEY